MIKYVIKRDGRKEPFTPYKIKNAIQKCIADTDKVVDDKILENISHTISQIDRVCINVEEIQDYVVKALSQYNYYIANKYQQYRIKRTKIRDANTNGKYYDTIVELATGVPNEISTENGNKDATQFNVMRDLIAGETCKKIYKETIMSPYLLELHNKGAIHVHDLDYRLMKGETNCCLLSLGDMLQNGTVLNGKRINKPHSLRTAVTIATQIILGVSSLQYGFPF